MKHCIFLLGLILLGISLQAQPIKPAQMSLQGKAYVVDGNVILRWQAATSQAWRYANYYGYNLVRYTLQRDSTPLTFEEIDSSKVVLLDHATPLDKEDWPLTSDQHKVMQACLYDTSFQIENINDLDIGQVMAARSKRELQYTIALLAASQNLEVAALADFAYLDMAINSDEQYVYQLSFNGVDTAITKSDTLVFIVNASKPSQFRDVEISDIIPGNKSAILSWDVSGLKNDYDTYMIQRSEMDTNHWVTITDKPVIYSGEGNNDVFHYKVSLPKNDTSYFFRIAGVTNFGQVRAYGQAQQVIGMPDKILAYPDIYGVIDSIPNKIILRWNFPVDSLPFIDGFNIFRSKFFGGPFTKLNNTLLSISDSIYTDNSPFPSNYYVVEAIDHYNRALASPTKLAQPFDTIAPLKPTGLIGKSNFKGEMLLKWNQNSDIDLYAYRVYVSNSMDGEFLQISKEANKDTISIFYPELQKITKEIWFKITAEDYRENVSVPSDAVMVKIKDVVPPPMPAILKATAIPGKVEFQFGLSQSDDLAKFVLQRRKLSGPKWSSILEFTPSTPITSYQDSTADFKLEYEYRLVAIDDVGNRSSSAVVRIKPIDDKVRAPIQNFSGVNIAQQRLFLQWNYINDVDLYGFQIWRGIDTNQLRPYVFISKDEAVANYLQVSFGSLPTVSNSIKCGYLDRNVNLNSIISQANYKNISGLASALPQGQGGVVNPVNPNQQIPGGSGVQHTLRYQVKAIYMDDASSPKSNTIQFNN